MRKCDGNCIADKYCDKIIARCDLSIQLVKDIMNDFIDKLCSSDYGKYLACDDREMKSCDGSSCRDCIDRLKEKLREVSNEL